MMTKRFTEPPPASCPLGYTDQDLERYFGARPEVPHPLWDQLRGQTGAICTGTFYNHETKKYEPSPCYLRPHGYISYIHDVWEWYEGKPVSDW